jgi:hypothetical protein
MMDSKYHYTIEFRTTSGDPLGQVAVKVDFAPACEWARLIGVRKGSLALIAYDIPATILPLWHSKLSQPYVQGFRIQIGSNGSHSFSYDFSTRYFTGLTTQASALLVEAGKLHAGDRFLYLVAAFPSDPAPTADTDDLKIEDVATAVPVSDGILAEFERHAMPKGEIDPELLPVFIPSRVITEATDLTRHAEQVETGGFLIGHLHRDPRTPEVFAEVTAQIPADHTVGELTKLSFKPETWTAVRAAITLRRKDEILLGWWHSHPVKDWDCRNCPIEKQRECVLSRGFLSDHDRAVHRSIFYRAWCVAMVVNDVAFSDPTVSVFGWDRGEITPRGYHIIDANPDVTRGICNDSQ